VVFFAQSANAASAIEAASELSAVLPASEAEHGIAGHRRGAGLRVRRLESNTKSGDVDRVPRLRAAQRLANSSSDAVQVRKPSPFKTKKAP